MLRLSRRRGRVRRRLRKARNWCVDSRVESSIRLIFDLGYTWVRSLPLIRASTRLLHCRRRDAVHQVFRREAEMFALIRDSGSFAETSQSDIGCNFHYVQYPCLGVSV